MHSRTCPGVPPPLQLGLITDIPSTWDAVLALVIDGVARAGQGSAVAAGWAMGQRVGFTRRGTARGRRTRPRRGGRPVARAATGEGDIRSSGYSVEVCRSRASHQTCGHAAGSRRASTPTNRDWTEPRLDGGYGDLVAAPPRRRPGRRSRARVPGRSAAMVTSVGRQVPPAGATVDGRRRGRGDSQPRRRRGGRTLLMRYPAGPSPRRAASRLSPTMRPPGVAAGSGAFCPAGIGDNA